MVPPDMGSPDMVLPNRGSIFLDIYINSKLGHSKSVAFASLRYSLLEFVIGVSLYPEVFSK